MRKRVSSNRKESFLLDQITINNDPFAIFIVSHTLQHRLYDLPSCLPFFSLALSISSTFSSHFTIRSHARALSCSFHPLVRSSQVFRRFSFLFFTILRSLPSSPYCRTSISVFTRSDKKRGGRGGGKRKKTRERLRWPQSKIADSENKGDFVLRWWDLRHLSFLPSFFLFCRTKRRAREVRKGQIGNWYVDCVYRAGRREREREREKSTKGFRCSKVACSKVRFRWSRAAEIKIATLGAICKWN
jgi:hypothetical protein